MDAIIYESGKPYWEVANRYHRNRHNPAIKPTAVRDMQRIQHATRSPAVLRRVGSFIALHRVQPPDGGGPRYA